MALRIVTDTLDEIPEPMRAGAKQQPGVGFVVSDMAEGWAFEDVAGMKNTVANLRANGDIFKGMLREFGWVWSDHKREWTEKGLDPAKAGDAREALEKLTAGQLRGSKEIEEFKTSIEKKMAAERATLESKLKARTDALRERMIKGELAPIVAKLGGSESMDAILALAERHIRLDEAEDGSLKHSIVDASGKPRVTKKSGSADPLGLDELIVEMREAPSTRGLFKASATGGSGSGSQSGGSGRLAVQDTSKLSPAELIALGNSRGT